MKVFKYCKTVLNSRKQIVLVPQIVSTSGIQFVLIQRRNRKLLFIYAIYFTLCFNLTNPGHEVAI